MKKFVATLLTALMLASLAAVGLSISAADGYVTAPLTFYGADGEKADPAKEENGWKLFEYWKGYNGTQIYDSHGEGMYVTTTVSCSKFWVGFGNGGGNGHDNIEIYVDDSLVSTYNTKDKADGSPNKTDVFEVTPGKHTIKVRAGTPSDPSKWNGFCINMIRYVPAEAKAWKQADFTLYSAAGEKIDTPADNLDWKPFPHWKGFDDAVIYDTNVTGAYAEATITCSEFWVGFGNGDKNGHTNIEIYVDGRLAATHRQKGWGEGYPDGLNQTDIIRVTPGEHTIKVVAGTPAEEGWNGMCVNVIEYVYDENKPTPPTSDVLLPAVTVCMTTASAAVVLKKKHS